jgi:hypothetical protein
MTLPLLALLFDHGSAARSGAGHNLSLQTFAAQDFARKLMWP